MNGYVRKFENVRKLLKKYSQIWKRVEKLLKTEFDSKPVYGNNDKYIKKIMTVLWIKILR